MNKSEFIKAISNATGFTQKDVKSVLETAQNITYAEMAKEGTVKVFEGLTLCGVAKEACTRRNPQTGEAIEVPAKTVPKAKFGKYAKDMVNDYNDYV